MAGCARKDMNGYSEREKDQRGDGDGYTSHPKVK